MFYTMIQNARDKWLNSKECKVVSLINYIKQTNKLRDVQIDAIKTYLYLKIACQNKSLATLFTEGRFNTLELNIFNDLPLSTASRNTLQTNPAARSLYEYAKLTNATKILKEIETNADKIDYAAFFKSAFYNVDYSDYLFSLPMGAGKTFLMAAFIYIDLFFAQNEKENPLFSKNFIILAPSGLKSSVVPSLKTIYNFEPSWVIPEPAASQIKKDLKFEVLEQSKTANKSNKIKNPNSQKIAQYQPFETCSGLVLVTNAEKVILDNLPEDFQLELGQSEKDIQDAKEKASNELRSLIGKIPHLSIFIDEVHHATDGEKKLRMVVNKWAESKNVNNVIGFSGTPYLEKQEKIAISENIETSSIEIANTVYYYPLVNAIGNFLKRPIVKISNNQNSLEIIESAVTEFLQTYKDTTFLYGEAQDRVLTSKLGIYCGKGIDFLENEVFPLVSKIVEKNGLNSDEAILKFHGKNKDKNQNEFDILDTPLSKKRIVLLCQIGKEGWDCKSLCGIVLSQDNACPTNMVLQTSCRALRQVTKENKEQSLIFLCESNAEKLNKQLKVQQNITLEEFQKGANANIIPRTRYNRADKLLVPNIDYFEFSIKYETQITELAEPKKNIPFVTQNTQNKEEIITTQKDFDTQNYTTTIKNEEKGNDFADYNLWLYNICAESFGFIKIKNLQPYNAELLQIFNQITYTQNEQTYFSSKYDQQKIKANIRKAFYENRDYSIKEELIEKSASLLAINNFKDTILIEADKEHNLYPDKNQTEHIIQADKGEFIISDEEQSAIDLLKKLGHTEHAKELEKQYSIPNGKGNSFHYIPYKTDSGFEQTFLSEVLSFEVIQKNKLEVYYNGDSSLTDFKINCYKKDGNRYQEVGIYTPDFLIIQRKDNKIYKAIIVETKGALYAHDPHFIERKSFTQEVFVKQNNAQFGYKKFDYLYIEDSEKSDAWKIKVQNTVEGFFNEKEGNTK